jgi:hypothetical protein
MYGERTQIVLPATAELLYGRFLPFYPQAMSVSGGEVGVAVPMYPAREAGPIPISSRAAVSNSHLDEIDAVPRCQNHPSVAELDGALRATQGLSPQSGGLLTHVRG